jgi:hypothetical protein
LAGGIGITIAARQRCPKRVIRARHLAQLIDFEILTPGCWGGVDTLLFFWIIAAQAVNAEAFNV